MEPGELVSVLQLDESELKKRLADLILDVSVLRGDFTLKSGRSSTWFIDGKQVVCDPSGVLLNAVAMVRIMDEFFGSSFPDTIGGMTMGADPVAFSVAAIASAIGRPLRSFSIRKEPKDHGPGGRVAGSIRPGDKVVIAEDVTSRGTSILAAANVAIEAGGEVVLATAMVDRGGTVADLMANVGIPFRAIFTAPELGLPFEGGLD